MRGSAYVGFGLSPFAQTPGWIVPAAPKGAHLLMAKKARQMPTI